MYPGWAGSVLWVSGPVSYEDLGLPADLVADLQRWEARWADAALLDAPAAQPDSRTHVREGRRLARRVADALGSGLVLELQVDRGLLPQRRFRGHGRPAVPAAATHVRALLARQAAE